MRFYSAWITRLKTLFRTYEWNTVGLKNFVNTALWPKLTAGGVSKNRPISHPLGDSNLNPRCNRMRLLWTSPEIILRGSLHQNDRCNKRLWLLQKISFFCESLLWPVLIKLTLNVDRLRQSINQSINVPYFIVRPKVDQQRAGQHSLPRVTTQQLKPERN